MKKIIIYTSVIALILAGLIYYFYYNVPVVEVVKAKKGNIERTVVDTGYVQAVDDYEIYSEQDGKIIKLDVVRGQKVLKDQTIMVLENKDISMVSQYFLVELTRAQTEVSSTEAALAKANLELADAQISYERTSKLFAAGAVSQAELDASTLARNKSRENVDELIYNSKLANEKADNYRALYDTSLKREEKLIIRSPLDGTILKLPVETGNVVTTGTLLASLGIEDHLEIKADLLGDDLGDVAIGQKVRVIAPVLGNQVLYGEIAVIYPHAEEKLSTLGVLQRRVPVIIKLDNTANLKPGYEIRVGVITASRENVIILPRQAIFSGLAGEKKVMLTADNKVRHVNVKTGLMDNRNIEITEGLNIDDLVIKDANKIIKENTRIRVKQE
ncbi:MAG: efflux RND transporter periplasmic adaptor subunit [Acidaminococcaceae bacterium]